jgi:HEPN domain-containing protein
MTTFKADRELASWYIRRAYHSYRQAKKLFDLFNYVEASISSFESIEFSTKALCKLLDVGFEREHFIDAETLSILAEKVEREHLGKKDEILQVIPKILGYTEKLRNISRYGIEKQGVPPVSPSRIFTRNYAAAVLEDARAFRNLLGSIEMKRRWKPKIKLAILNGYVTGVDEKKCSKYPFTNSNPDFWKNKLQALNSASQNKFEIKEINAAEISEEFAVVVNPFGEVYPEIDLKSKAVFYLIKDYVEDGGVYVNTAGFPFFYGWNVMEGKEYPISEERVILPTTLQVSGRVITATQVQMFIQFTGTLLYKEFNAIPAPVSKPRKVYQEDEDKTMFGDLIGNLAEINEFRGLPKHTPNCIPIVRAKDEVVEEVYPISALKRGNGYLLLAGMNTSNDVEADLFVKAIDSFCVWKSNQLQ